jgi:FKBP12-rapamycin complex-associated protein
MSSKQRPRRMSLQGSDGRTYEYLLKGHEDLRMDERAMSLFGLVNNLLSQDAETAKRGLGIVRFSVTPLSQNSGLIGWVSNCDTMHSLIQQYRSIHKVCSCVLVFCLLVSFFFLSLPWFVRARYNRLRC